MDADEVVRADKALAEGRANAAADRPTAIPNRVTRVRSTPPVPNPEPVQTEQPEPTMPPDPSPQPNTQPDQLAPPPEPQTLAEGSTRPALYFWEAQTALFYQNWERATALATTGMLSLLIGAIQQAAVLEAEQKQAQADKAETNGA